MIISFVLTEPVEDMYREYLGAPTPTQDQLNDLNQKMNKVKHERGWIQNKCGRKNLLSKHDSDNEPGLLAWCIRLSLYDLWLDLNREINKTYSSKVDTCTIPYGFKLTLNHHFDTVQDAIKASEDIMVIINHALGKLNNTILRCDYCIMDDTNDKIPSNEKTRIDYQEVGLPLSKNIK